MKASDFKNFIEKAKKVVPKRTTVKTFSLCHFENGWMTVRNDEVQVQVLITTTPAKDNCIIPFCVDFYEFERIISKLKNESINFKIEEKTAIIESNVGNFSIERTDIDSFEFFTLKGDMIAVDTYSEGDIIEISKALNYAAEDELRPSLCQIHFEDGRIIASDGYFFRYGKRESGTELMPYGISRRMAELLDGHFGAVSSYENAIEIIRPDLVVVGSKLAKFPDGWKRLMFDTEKTVTTIEIKKGQLNEVLKYADLAANPSSKLIKIRVEGEGRDKQVHFEAEDLDFKRKYSRLVNCKGGGEEICIGYKIPFLEKFMKVEKPDVVRFDFVAPDRPTLLNGHTILMPMAIK